MDQLNALKPASVDEVQKVLFLHKMPAYIRDKVNPRDFPDLPPLTEQCNKIWESRSQDVGAAAAAVPFPWHCRSFSPFRSKRPAAGKSGKRGSPMPGPSRTAVLMATASTTRASDHNPSARTAAHTRKMSRLAVANCTTGPLTPVEIPRRLDLYKHRVAVPHPSPASDLPPHHLQ
jgi:hypothetical protein